MVSIHIKGCTVEDADGLGNSNIRAYWEEPMWRILWPDNVTLDFMIQEMTKKLPMDLLKDADNSRHEMAVDGETGAVMGYIRWIFPDGVLNGQQPDEIKWKTAQVPRVSEEKFKELEKLDNSAWCESKSLGALGNRLGEAHMRIMSKQSYIELDYLAVHPHYQKKGVASALVQSGLKQAQELGVPVYVNAWKSALGVYSKLGFEEVDRVVGSDTGLDPDCEVAVYFMVHDPASQG